MAYELYTPQLNKTIVKLSPDPWQGTSETFAVVNEICNNHGGVEWINLNVKLDPSTFTKGYYRERNVGIKGHASPLYIQLYSSLGTNSNGSIKLFEGDGTSGNPYKMSGFYPGGHFYVSVSARDNERLGESGFADIYTYSKPRIENKVVGSITSPQTTGANNSSLKIQVFKLNKPYHPGLETFVFRVKRSSYNEGNTNVNAPNSTGESIIGSNIYDSLNSYGSERLVLINTSREYVVYYEDLYKYEIDMSNYNKLKNIVPPSDDGKVVRLEFYHTSQDKSSGRVIYSASEITDRTIYYIRVYFRPRIPVTSDSELIYRINNSNGMLIVKNPKKQSIVQNGDYLKNIYVQWNYNINNPLAGFVQGYRVQMYDYQHNLVKTYYTSVNNLTIPKNDIPKLNSTYLKITPYFKNDQTDPNKYWYYQGTVEEIPFVQLISTLEKPKITYPVNNSNWINHEFRVCFDLPNDPDQPYILKNYEDTSIPDEQKSYAPDEYRYEDVEIKISGLNGSRVIRIGDSYFHTTDVENIKDPEVFNALYENLTHKRKIVVYPNLNDFIDPIKSSTYDIQVRVKKKYKATQAYPWWSEWSEKVTFKVTKTPYEVQPGELILASHFNTALDKVDRCRLTYGLQWNDRQPLAVSKSTIIQAQQYNYKNMFEKIVQTKMQVNNYGTFDTGRENVKFDHTNQIPENFNEQIGEVVTALQNKSNEYSGRNYIHYIHERCEQLL